MARIPPGARTDPGALSPRRLLIAFGYAWEGLVYTWREQPNFRVEVGIGALALGLAAVLGVSPVPVLLAVGLVLGLELLNTGVEALVDLASPEPHPLAKAAKDAAAAAVLVASAAALAVGLLVFLPPLWRLVAR